MIFHVICSMFVISLAQVSAFFSQFVEGRQAHLCMHSFHSSPAPFTSLCCKCLKKWLLTAHAAVN